MNNNEELSSILKGSVKNVATVKLTKNAEIDKIFAESWNALIPTNLTSRHFLVAKNTFKDTRKCQDSFLDHETCQDHHEDSGIDTYHVTRSCSDDQNNKKEATIFDFEEEFVPSEHLNVVEKTGMNSTIQLYVS